MSFFGNLSSFVELLVFSVGQRRKLWCTWLWWWPFGAFKSNTVGKQFLHDHCQSVVPSTQAGLEVGVWWILDSVLFFISPNIYIYIYFARFGLVDAAIREKLLFQKKVSFRRLAVGAPPALPHWQRAFGKLPLATVLNVTQWDSFESRANEVLPTSCSLEGWHFEIKIRCRWCHSSNWWKAMLQMLGSLVCEIFILNQILQTCTRL